MSRRSVEPVEPVEAAEKDSRFVEEIDELAISVAEGNELGIGIECQVSRGRVVAGEAAEEAGDIGEGGVDS